MDIAHPRHETVAPLALPRNKIALRRWAGGAIVVAGLVLGAAHLWASVAQFDPVVAQEKTVKDRLPARTGPAPGA